ncbi:MAG: hypothetical protein ACLQAT_09115 [Candidatus Binataceae bacterium]
MSNLGAIGAAGAFPAVEAADNMAMHLSGGPYWWHCDEGDYLDSSGYPQSRAAATQKILDCRLWAQRMLGDGLVGNKQYCQTSPRISWLCTGVAATSHKMLNGKGKVDVSQPASFSFLSGCSFNGASGRIKCEVLQQFGYALHAIEDYYSHSNYADLNYTSPITWQNPPGIGSTTTPKFWDMTIAMGDPSLLPDPNLSSGCYPDKGCISATRTPHEYLNKDKSDIDPVTGIVTNPRTPRGQMVPNGVSNAQLAVSGAIEQVRAAWSNLQTLIIKKEGSARAAKIICAIASDTPNSCGLAAGASVPQEEFTEPGKVAPYDWVVRENQANLDNLEALRNGSLTQRVAIGPSGVVGITNQQTTNCGDVTVDSKDVIPGIPGIVGGREVLTANNLTVAGASCADALTLLQEYHLANTKWGAKRNLTPDLQCVAMATNPDPNSNDANIVCKNQDESIEMSFVPTCGDAEGDCGI